MKGGFGRVEEEHKVSFRVANNDGYTEISSIISSLFFPIRRIIDVSSIVQIAFELNEV